MITVAFTKQKKGYANMILSLHVFAPIVGLFNELKCGSKFLEK